MAISKDYNTKGINNNQNIVWYLAVQSVMYSKIYLDGKTWTS